VLAAHGAVVALLFFGFGLGGHGHAGDGMLQRDDGLDRARKGQLHRAADLAAVHARGHDGAKGAHVKEVLAHPLPGQRHLVGAALALVLAGFFFLASLAAFSVASSACSSGAAARFNAE
jgi:hypothetical protein